jgi:hypothetical protein
MDDATKLNSQKIQVSLLKQVSKQSHNAYFFDSEILAKDLSGTLTWCEKNGRSKF